MDSGACIKTSEAKRQSKHEFEKRIGTVLNRLIAATKAFIAARQADGSVHR